ncbi:MAG: leucine-rich repeat domain-containing protein [Oscillospiraceae bacterium]|nr:leucine-rich repeat domain-containing protein [Oscillospiraceae bacterium]
MKRKTIRLFTLLLALALCLGALGAAPAMAEDITFTDSASGLTFKVTSETTVEVTAGNPSGSLAIPATVTYDNVTYRVTAIGKQAFQFCLSLNSVTIPEGVTSIGESAFYYCLKLAAITIPSSVTDIGSYAFNSCESLTVTIPATVTSVGRSAFSTQASVTVLVNSDSDLTKMSSSGASNIVYQYAPPKM